MTRNISENSEDSLETQEKVATDEQPSTIAHDGKKIDTLFKNMPEKMSKTALMEELGFNRNSYNLMITKEKYPIGLKGLIKLAEIFKCDILDIVKDDIQDDIDSIKFEDFRDKAEMNARLLELEKKYNGRQALLTVFPSHIHRSNGEGSERRRFLYSKDIDNVEIYSYLSILEFAFSPFSKRTKEQKINDVKSALERTHVKNCIYIMDEDFFANSGAECEIVGKKHDGYVLVLPPVPKYGIWKIRSPKLISKLLDFFGHSHVHSLPRTLKLLIILLDSLEKDHSLIEFAKNLAINESSFYKPIMDSVSPNLREQIERLELSNPTPSERIKGVLEREVKI